VVLQDGFDLTNATLHMALFVLCGVVVTVFLQITHLTGPPDSRSNLDATASREVEVFGLQAFEGNTR
jgi:hypothetical protein